MHRPAANFVFPVSLADVVWNNTDETSKTDTERKQQVERKILEIMNLLYHTPGFIQCKLVLTYWTILGKEQQPWHI